MSLEQKLYKALNALAEEVGKGDVISAMNPVFIDAIEALLEYEERNPQ